MGLGEGVVSSILITGLAARRDRGEVYFLARFGLGKVSIVRPSLLGSIFLLRLLMRVAGVGGGLGVLARERRRLVVEGVSAPDAM